MRSLIAGVAIAAAAVATSNGFGGTSQASVAVVADQTPMVHARAETPPVRWSGWQGVKFGTSVEVAYERLGGTFYPADPNYPTGGCGDVLQLTTGQMDGHANPDPHAVGNITAYAPVAYPLGIRADMRPTKIVKLVLKSRFRLHTRVTQPYGEDLHEDWVVGKGGHTLYFSYTDTDTDPRRLGLAIDKRTARGQLGMNGC